MQWLIVGAYLIVSKVVDIGFFWYSVGVLWLTLDWEYDVGRRSKG